MDQNKSRKWTSGCRCRRSEKLDYYDLRTVRDDTRKRWELKFRQIVKNVGCRVSLVSHMGVSRCAAAHTENFEKSKLGITRSQMDRAEKMKT